MTVRIVDASVATRWFVDEPNNDAALEVLEAIRRDPREFVVPELFFNEMLAVLCKLIQDSGEAKRWMSALAQLGLHRVGNGGELLARAAELAVDRKLTGYDAVYAATADSMRGVWLTADARAHKKLSGLGISELVA